MLTITKEFTFHAAHRLYHADFTAEQNLQIYGNCSRLHGHSYRLQVTLSGTADATGMILHFDRLKQIVRREILDRYDHADLNQLEEYRQMVPTAENMVEYIFHTLERALEQLGCRLHKIRLFETPTAWADKTRDAAP